MISSKTAAIRRIIAGNTAPDSVCNTDTETMTVIGSTAFGDDGAFAISSSTWFLKSAADTVSVLDSDGVWITDITIGATVGQIFYATETDRIYVGRKAFLIQQIVVINPATNTIETTHNLADTLATRYIWHMPNRVINQSEDGGGNEIYYVYDIANIPGGVIGSIICEPAASTNGFMEYVPSTDRLWISMYHNVLGSQLWEVNPTTLVTENTVAQEGYAMTYNPITGALLIEQDNTNIIVFDPVNRNVVCTIPVDSCSTGEAIGVDYLTGRAYYYEDTNHFIHVFE